jgi:hypothetical protein
VRDAVQVLAGPGRQGRRAAGRRPVQQFEGFAQVRWGAVGHRRVSVFHEATPGVLPDAGNAVTTAGLVPELSS